MDSGLFFHHPTNYLHNDGSSDISAIQMAFRLAVHCRAEICDIYIYISFHLGKHKIITQYNKRYPIYGLVRVFFRIDTFRHSCRCHEALVF